MMVITNSELERSIKTSVTRDDDSERPLLRLVDHEDPMLDVVYRSLVAPFFSVNDRDSCEAIQSYLLQNEANRKKRIQFYVAAALINRIPVGATIFAFFGWDDFCLMSGHYTAVLPEARGKHLATRLDEFRLRVAGNAAEGFGYAGLNSAVITIPVSNDVRAISEGNPLDEAGAVENVWRHLGYRQVDFPFVQLPLSDEKQASPQSLWIKQYNRHERDHLPGNQMQRILEACNYFRRSEEHIDSYSEYRAMIELLRNMSEVRVLK